MASLPSPTKTWHKSVYPSIDPSRPELSLAGKSVVITGGGSGIGLAISKAVALAGASRLAIIGRRAKVLSKAKAEIEALFGDKTQVFIVSADVGNKEQIEGAFSQISSAFGGRTLDLLVNNAGYFTGLHPFGTETLDEWTTAIDVNIKGVYIVATAFIANAKADATIVNVSSGMVHLPASFRTGFSSYSSTKLAGSKIMEFIQAENPSLHVVDIHPGQVTETEMAGKVVEQLNLPHIDDADLAGHFTVWVASPEARFLKGKFLWVNWDVDELKENAKDIESSALFTLGLDGFSSFKYNDTPKTNA